MDIVLPSINIHTLLIMAHVLGTTLGVGGATISDLLFFRATQDGRIEAKEWEILKMVSLVIWVGLLLAVASGLGFLLEYAMTPEKTQYLANPKIWAKLTIVGIIFANGLLLHWKLFPIFESMVGRPMGESRFVKNMTLVFTSGAVSITSWYIAFIMGTWRGLNFTLNYWQLLLVYGVILASAIVVANVVGRMHAKPHIEIERT